MEKKILCGLDIGTNSVGWCVTDENYKIIKKRGKSLWGVRMFDEASDASARRGFRTNRRRLHRRKERLSLLKDLFFEPMKEIDDSFFYRLENSMFKDEDRTSPFDYTLFNSKDFTDKDYYSRFPTIYHLRKHLIESDDKEDLRLIYLALHHMIKYRGHFLKEGEEFKGLDVNDLTKEIQNLNNQLLNLEYEDYPFSTLSFSEEICNDLIDTNKKARGITELKEKFNHYFNPNNNDFLKTILIPFICGAKIDLKKIKVIDKDDLESLDKKDICVKDENFDDTLDALKASLSSHENLLSIFENAKNIYQFFLLSKLLGENTYLCNAMVDQYNKHQNELKLLKKYIKGNHPTEYGRLFRVPKKDEVNYSSYIGSYNVNGDKARTKHGEKEKFYKLLKEILKIDKIKKVEDIDDPFLKNVFLEIANGTYLSFINSTSNGVFPYQLNLLEMNVILEKQSKFYSFLNETDEEGYLTINKIKSLLTFKIPYYVGPLAEPKEGYNHSWIVRKEKGKITPWNFESKVDKDESAKAFIERMLTKCSYLHNEYCLPLNSIIFSYYNVLSFLNKLHVNGAPINYEIKMDLIKNVFLTKRKVTIKDIKNYFYNIDKEINISTSNGKSIEAINCNMASYIDFRTIFTEEYIKENIDQIEQIIRDIVIFEDKTILAKRLKNEYNLEDSVIKVIKGFNYKKYSKLSKKLLIELTSFDKNGEVIGSILSIMQNSNQNLMEIINDERYNFQTLIADENRKGNSELSPEDYIEELYISPGMKRPLIQAYKIIEELEKILKRPIDEFYVECTRTNKEKKKTSKSRYEKLKDLYKAASEILKDDILYKRLHKQLLEITDTSIFQSDKYYLYFTQMGKCMYSGEPIDLEDLFDTSKYDIDHIIPQSIIKDDSLNNRILVSQASNREKKDYYPIPQSILFHGDYRKAYAFYNLLKKAGLITEEKYNRLTKRELLESELANFVNRQLVITNQAVKGLIELLKQYKPTSKIVYSKGENVSDFRKTFDLPKSRTANNFHHAHDAYLNIVVGRTIDLYFGPYHQNHTTLTRMHAEGLTTNQSKLFLLNNIKLKSGLLLWNKNEMITMINHYLYETFDVMITTRTYFGSEIYKKVTIYPVGIGNVPVKSSGPLINTERYGGFEGYSFGFYTLINIKGQHIFEAIPTIYKSNIKEYLDKFYKDYEIVIEKLKINTVIKLEKTKICITGRSGKTSNYFKNLNERIFSKKHIKLIHDIDKLLEKIKNLGLKITGNESVEEINQHFICDDSRIVAAPVASKGKEIVLFTNDMIDLYDYLISLFSKEIYNFSASKTVVEKMIVERETFFNLSILGKIILISNILSFLKCNERKAIDLSIIGGSKEGYKTSISTKLKNCKIISESITGFYTKVLKEIK